MLRIVPFAKKASILMIYVYRHAVTATTLGALVCTLLHPTNASCKAANKNSILNGDCHLDMTFQKIQIIISTLQLCLVSSIPYFPSPLPHQVLFYLHIFQHA
jgi:hypothetical protein